MEETIFPEALVSIHQSKWRHNPEDWHVHQNRPDKLKPLLS
jgi:hypothetical protein